MSVPSVPVLICEVVKYLKETEKFQNLQCAFKSRKSRRGLKADDPADQIAVNLQQLYLIYCVIYQLRFPGINEELDHSIPHPFAIIGVSNDYI